MVAISETPLLLLFPCCNIALKITRFGRMQHMCDGFSSRRGLLSVTVGHLFLADR